MSGVAILGAGPTALMAAYAVERNGHEPTIFARECKPAVVNEDMFLYKALPDWPDQDPFRLEVYQWGNGPGYAERCYGDPTIDTSWNHLPTGTIIAWWLKPTYDLLWNYFEGCIEPPLDINYHAADVLTREFPLVISTLPAPAICRNPEHEFVDRQTWLARYKNDEFDRRDPHQMIYNGDLNYGSKWFRYTYLNGWRTWEYAMAPPASEVTPETPIMPGKKFLSNTCDCLPRVYRVGRWAQWKRGVLNHHAFEQATSILASCGLGKGA